MDFPAQYPDSPAKPLSGPVRARLAARQNRTSSLKPYSRRSSAAGLIPVISGSSSDLAAVQPRTPGRSLAVSGANEAKSPFSSLRAASPLALLGSVGKAFSRPLSWLASSSTAAKSDLDDAGMPRSSSSSNSLASIARKRAAHEASSSTAKNHVDDIEREAPSLAARAIGARLAVGVLGSPQQRNDLESQGGEVRREKQQQQQQQDEPVLRRSARTAAARSALSPPPVASSSRLSRGGDDPATAGGALQFPMTRSRTSRRVLDLGRTEPDDSQMELLKSRSPSPAASGALARTRQRLSVGQSPLAASGSHAGAFATVGYRRGTSLRPDDGLDARMSPSQSSPSFAFGYGNERRVARSSFGLPPTASPFQLATRSPLAPRAGRSSLGPSFGSEVGLSPQPFRGGSLGPRSVAANGSYRASSPAMRGTTPKQRRDWGSLGLAASRSPGPGDYMMREYIATRTLPGVVPRSLGMSIFSDPRGSRAGSVAADETMSLTPSKLGKRDIDMSIDGDEDRSITASAQKRQMVWHPQLGFVSQEELRAREPRPPSPKNEAERLLGVLESMKGPSRAGRVGSSVAGSSTASRMLQAVSVPAPVSDRSASANLHGRLQSVGVAPYSRALRKSKLALSQQTADEPLSLRAKLRRSRPTPQPVEADDVSGDELYHRHGEEEDVKGMQDSETETDEEPAPPRKRATRQQPVRRSRRIRARDGGESNEDEEMDNEDAVAAKPQSNARTKAQQPKARADVEPVAAAASAQRTEPAKPNVENAAPAPASAAAAAAAAAASKPSSQRISLAAAKPTGAQGAPAPAPKKDNFSVRTTQADGADGGREKSSLRQSAVKKFRTHQSSGRISAWEEDLDEDEDLPDAEDLSMIRLPTNLFPTGLSFGGGDSAASKPPTKPAATETAKPALSFSFGAVGAAPGEDGQKKDEPANGGSESSSPLLGRLGGFSAPAPSNASAAKPAPASSFSFTAPTKENPKPSFSFSAPKLDEAKAPAAAAASKLAPATSNFFSTPAESVKPAEDEKKSGPVPNFFGGALSKAAAEPAAEPPKSTGASFSFGKPEGIPAFTGFGEPVAAASSAEKKEAELAKPAGGFSFGAPPASSAAPAKKESTPAAAAPSSFGAAPAPAPVAAAAGASHKPFSFGSATDAQAGDKKDAPEAAVAKPAALTFAFGAPASGAAASSTSSFGGFGKPAASPAPIDDKEKTVPSAVSAAKIPNFFGSSGASASSTDAPKPSESKQGSPFSFSSPAAPAAATGASSPSFTFGKPAGAADEGKPAALSPSTEAPKPSFSFSTPSGSTTPAAAKTSGVFTFGAPASSSSPPAPATPVPAPSFTGFGTPAQTFGNSEMMEDSPTAGAGVGAGAAVPSVPKFTFGASTPATVGAANGTANGGASPFGGGASAAGANGTSSGVPASKPVMFSFGAPAAEAGGGSSNPQTPKFGAAALPSGSTSMFGSPAPAPAAAPGATSAPSKAFTFGSSAPSPAQPPNMFGGSSAPTPFDSTPSSPAPFTFGAPQQPQQTQPSSSTFTFGTPNASSQPQGFTFGSAANTPSQQQQQPPGASGGMFTFGSQHGAVTPSTNSAATPFAFGAPQSQPTTPGAGSPFAFNAGPAPAQPAFGAPQQQQQDAVTATPPGSAGGLFNMGAAPAAQTPGGRAIKPLRQRRRN